MVKSCRMANISVLTENDETRELKIYQKKIKYLDEKRVFLPSPQMPPFAIYWIH